MISVTRVLPFEQYAASNYLALRHGTFKRRFCCFAYVRLGPLLAIIGLPVTLWLMVHAWRAPGQHGAEFGASCGLAWYFGYLGFYPLLFKRKMRKLYREQELSLPWTIELSQEDIHSVIQGRSDTRFQWVYFNSFVETNEMFTLLKKQRPVFLTIAKENLQPREQDELRSLLLAKLGPAL
jgi:hypothetical protein